MHDPRSRLRLHAVVAPFANYSGDLVYQWTAAGMNLTSLGARLTDPNSSFLVVSEEALVANATLAFTVTATAAGDGALSGEATLRVRVNGGPAGGTCHGVPSQGWAYNTSFTLNVTPQ